MACLILEGSSSMMSLLHNFHQPELASMIPGDRYLIKSLDKEAATNLVEVVGLPSGLGESVYVSDRHADVFELLRTASEVGQPLERLDIVSIVLNEGVDEPASDDCLRALRTADAVLGGNSLNSVKTQAACSLASHRAAARLAKKLGLVNRTGVSTLKLTGDVHSFEEFEGLVRKAAHDRRAHVGQLVEKIAGRRVDRHQAKQDAFRRRLEEAAEKVKSRANEAELRARLNEEIAVLMAESHKSLDVAADDDFASPVLMVESHRALDVGDDTGMDSTSPSFDVDDATTESPEEMEDEDDDGWEVSTWIYLSCLILLVVVLVVVVTGHCIWECRKEKSIDGANAMGLQHMQPEEMAEAYKKNDGEKMTPAPKDTIVIQNPEGVKITYELLSSTESVLM